MSNIKFLILGFFISINASVPDNTDIITISGIIRDKSTNEALPSANIFYHKKFIGTTSDANGRFTLTLRDTDISDSITISYMGYEPIKTVLENCIDKNIFSLKPVIYDLEEFVLKSESAKREGFTTFGLRRYMREVIYNYNNSRRETPHIALAHYSEKAKADDKYIMFMESIGYSVYSGELARAVPLSNYKFFCKNTKCHTDNPLWMKYAKDLEYTEMPLPGGSITLNVFRTLEINGLLSARHYRLYSFSMDSVYIFNNKLIRSVEFERNNIKGIIHVFDESREILKIECSTDSYVSTAFHTRLNANVIINFNYYDDTPYVSSIESFYKHKGLEYYNTLTVLLQKTDEFEVTEDEYWAMNSYDVNPFIEYSPEEWNNYNIPQVNDWSNIKADLKPKNMNIEEVFINNSGRWFKEFNSKGEKRLLIIAQKKISELEKLF